MATRLMGWLGSETSPAGDRGGPFVRWRYLLPLLGLAAGALAGFAVASVIRRNRRTRTQLELAPDGVAVDFDKGGVALSAAQGPGPGPEAATAADAEEAAAGTGTDTAEAAAGIGTDTAGVAGETGTDTAVAAAGAEVAAAGTGDLPSGPPAVDPHVAEAAPADATARPQRARRSRKIES